MKEKVAVLRRGKALPPVAGSDERRLHMRAHGYWATLARPCGVPLWRDFDPLMVDDRCTQSFMLDLGVEGEPPNVRLIGSALKAEGGLEADIIGLEDAPPGSLLMRLSSYFPELVTRRTPLSVDAPFRTNDGRPGIYRGLLMPFSSDGEAIDVIFGVLSWRELTSPPLPTPAGAGATVHSLTRK